MLRHNALCRRNRSAIMSLVALVVATDLPKKLRKASIVASCLITFWFLVPDKSSCLRLSEIQSRCTQTKEQKDKVLKIGVFYSCRLKIAVALCWSYQIRLTVEHTEYPINQSECKLLAYFKVLHQIN